MEKKKKTSVSQKSQSSTSSGTTWSCQTTNSCWGTLWEGRVRHEFQTQVKEVLFVSSGLINCENTSWNETYLKELFRRVIYWQLIDGGSWIPSDYFCCIFKSEQLQCHYLVFIFTLSPDDVKQFYFFTQPQLNCSAFIMCPDIILESYYVTGSDNNGVFLPYYCIQYALYGQAVYIDLCGYCARNLQWPTLITLYVRPDLQWPYIVGLTDQSWGKKTEGKKKKKNPPLLDFVLISRSSCLRFKGNSSWEVVIVWLNVPVSFASRHSSKQKSELILPAKLWWIIHQ